MLLEIFLRSDAALVASICQRWRSLALSYSQFWTSIQINTLSASSIALGKLHSERSRDCLINIVFVMGKARENEHQLLRMHANLSNAIDLLMSAICRIQQFVVDYRLVGSIFSQLPDAPYHFPQLRSLKIQYRNGTGATKILPSNVKVPALKELHLSNHPCFTAGAFRNNPFPYSSISDLRLSVCSVRSVIVLLVHLKQVEILQLADIYEFDSVSRINAENMDWKMIGVRDGLLHYPSLRSLTIQMEQSIFQIFFQHTQFPNIKHLRIEQRAVQFTEQPFVELWWPTFRNVTTLDISWSGSFPELFSGFESVKIVRLLECGIHVWTERSIQMLVEFLPKSVDVLQLEDEVIWRRA